MDKQIIINYLQLFILPLVLGVGLRLAFKNFSEAWLVTAAFAVLSVIWIIVSVFRLGRNYEAHPLLALQSIISFSGALITAGACALIKKKKVKTE